MHDRTEDLLTILDGEPMDAELRARLLADPSARDELERLQRVRDRLAALPELEPPPGTWARVEAAAEARPAARRKSRSTAAAAAAAALAALAGLAALSALVIPRAGDSPAVAHDAGDASYRPLIERSIELERALARVPAARPVMSLGTAGTIAGLEERIAYVDAQLARGTAENWAPEYQAALWSERVDLMTALVRVRFAQYATY